jgi:hypothetical protein
MRFVFSPECESLHRWKRQFDADLLDPPRAIVGIRVSDCLHPVWLGVHLRKGLAQLKPSNFMRHAYEAKV